MKRFARLQHNLEVSGDNPAQVLTEWIRKLKRREGKPIVLLIDQNDAPISRFLYEKDPEKAQTVVEMLRPLIRR
jgi:hypothetical protein